MFTYNTLVFNSWEEVGAFKANDLQLPKLPVLVLLCNNSPHSFDKQVNLFALQLFVLFVCLFLLMAKTKKYQILSNKRHKLIWS